MNRLDEMLRNVISGALVSAYSIASGILTVLEYIEPIVGLIAVIIGAIAAFATFRAQTAKRRTEELQQREIELRMQRENP